MKKKSHSGFSIIELIVAMTIFITITAITLVNYNTINSHLTLDTLAHQIAQWARETQVAAMSVKRAGSGVGFPGYGLHFDPLTPSQFLFFADLDGNRRYTPPLPGVECGDPGAECEKTIALMRGNSIARLCGSSNGNPAGSCETGFEQPDQIDVVFTRPNPDAEILGDISGTEFRYARVQISIVAPSGYTRTVEVWTTGQVTVQ